jgi:hypothetical protein
MLAAGKHADWLVSANIILRVEIGVIKSSGKVIKLHHDTDCLPILLIYTCELTTLSCWIFQTDLWLYIGS